MSRGFEHPCPCMLLGMALTQPLLHAAPETLKPMQAFNAGHEKLARLLHPESDLGAEVGRRAALRCHLSQQPAPATATHRSLLCAVALHH